MSTPDISQQAVYQGGNSVFDKVHILDELVYDFTKSGTLSINSVGVCTFTKVNTDQLEAVNSNVTGISTVDGNFYLTGALLDSSGDTGASGQILASTGSGTNWIAANTTSVANAINVGVNEVSDDAEKFVSFFSGNSGNLPNQVDAGIKYNPSTNLLTTTVTTAQVAQNLTGTPTISVNAITASGSVTASSFIGDGSNLTNIQAGQVQGNSIFVQGMIIMWNSTVASIPTGFVLCDGNNGTPDLRNRFVVGAGTGGNYSPGNTGGADSVTLTLDQIPAHTHTWDRQDVSINNGYRPWPANNNDCSRSTQNTGSAGGGQSHENRPPYYALCYIMKT